MANKQQDGDVSHHHLYLKRQSHHRASVRCQSAGLPLLVGRALRGTPCECALQGIRLPYLEKPWHRSTRPTYFCACQNRASLANSDGDPVASPSVGPCNAEVYIRPAAQVQDMSHLGMLSGSVRYSPRNRTMHGNSAGRGFPCCYQSRRGGVSWKVTCRHEVSA